MSMKIGKKKITGVERSIQVFIKKNHELLSEINIDISLEELSKIVTPKEDDPFLYEFYKLDKQQLDQILSWIKDFPKPDFKKYYYVVACFGIYK